MAVRLKSADRELAMSRLHNIIWTMLHPSLIGITIASGAAIALCGLFVLGGMSLVLLGIFAAVMRLFLKPEWLLKLSWRTRNAKPMHSYRSARFAPMMSAFGHEGIKMYEIMDDKVQAYAASTPLGSVVGISSEALRQCSDEELHVLYAHEVAHLKLGHHYLRWAYSVAALLALLIFFIMATEGVAGLAALPPLFRDDPVIQIVALLGVAGIFPVTFMLGRITEWQADDIAVAVTQNGAAVIRILKMQQSRRPKDTELHQRIERLRI
jgi:Zn-dependent protease with chaperone function